MIIDHLSVQRADTVAQAFGAYEEVLAVARYPGIHIKVGNGPNRSRRPYPFEDVHDYLRGIHQAFGARRMLVTISRNDCKKPVRMPIRRSGIEHEE